MRVWLLPLVVLGLVAFAGGIGPRAGVAIARPQPAAPAPLAREVDTMTDVANCGGRGRACPPGEACDRGACGVTCIDPAVPALSASGALTCVVPR